MSEEVSAIYPLKNFDSDTRLLMLDERTLLRPIDSSEIKKLKECYSFSTNVVFALEDVRYALETKIGTNPYLPDFDENSSLVRNTTLALRLLKRGDVYISSMFWLEKSKVIGYGNVSPGEAFFRNPYFLKKEEIESFSQLWNRLQKVNDAQPYLKFPLTQFTRAFEERASEEFSDSIVDYMIALESLVFYEESRSIEPAGRVIGIAIGMLLGNNNVERTKIKETLIQAYGIRNAKVHGNIEKLQKYGSNVEKLSIDVEDHLRRVFKRFLGE